MRDMKSGAYEAVRGFGAAFDARAGRDKIEIIHSFSAGGVIT